MEKQNTEAAVANNGQTVAGNGKCPVAHGAHGRRNRDWWPSALDVSVLHRNSRLSDPMGGGFDYAKAFESLDLADVRSYRVRIEEVCQTGEKEERRVIRSADWEVALDPE